MSDTPNVVIGVQTDYKKLFYSNPDIALTKPIQLAAGYGVLKMGLVVAKNASAAGNVGKYFPYDPASTVTGAEEAPGRAYLVQSSGTSASILYVTLDDSYKFKVGDDVIIHDDTTAAENLGAITAIDRTTYNHMAAITVTVATGGTSFTTARFAYITIEGYATAAGILIRSVDTGTGASAAGAGGVLLLSNAILYTGMLQNCDSTARSTLSATLDGPYVIFK